jgi:hypothetical protein
MDTLLTTTYAAYLVISASMTIWVARTLFRHGRPFLSEAFRGRAELADSVNHLLVVGSYPVNLGYVSPMRRASAPPDSIAGALELLSVKIGWVLLVLGGMHFMKLYLFSRLRRSGVMEHLFHSTDVTEAES